MEKSEFFLYHSLDFFSKYIKVGDFFPLTTPKKFFGGILRLEVFIPLTIPQKKCGGILRLEVFIPLTIPFLGVVF